LEDERSPYLYDVIHATGEPLYYVERIAGALYTLGTSGRLDNLYPEQLIRLAVRLTKNEIRDLREPMYRAVGSVVEEDYGIAHIQEEIIALDGVAGYWRLVEQVRHRLRPDEERWTEIGLIDELSRQLGKTATAATLKASAEGNAERMRYLEVIQKVRRRQEYRASLSQRRKKKTFVLSDVRAYINAPPEKRVPKPRMKFLHEAVRRRVWSDFKTETDPVRQLRYIKILRTCPYIPFPGDPKVVLPLIQQTESEQLARQAVRLLEDTRHASVRAAALELVTRKERVPHAIELLASNPGEGDLQLLENVVRQEWKGRAFEYIGMGIRRYIKNCSSPDYVPILLACYEKLACSFCRNHVVEMLLQQDALPTALREECFFDADGDTRDLFRSSEGT
jgi:hypothetical protein